MTAGVFNFGDRIPSGPITDKFVSYDIDGFPGGFLSGPYPDDEVVWQMNDISTYDKVKNVKIVTRGELLELQR